MKLMYINQHFSTPKGGTGVRAYEFAKAWVNKGHEVTVICGSNLAGTTGLENNFKNGLRSGKIDGIEVVEFQLDYHNSHSFFKRGMTFIKFTFKSCKVVMKSKYDILFATSTPLTVAIPGVFSKIFKRKPFVFEVRDLWPELPKAMGAIKNIFILWGLSSLEWIAYKTSDKCIALSPGIKDGIAKRGIVRENIEIIPNGCDIDFFSNPNLKPWRPDEIQENDFLAIFSGTHGMANGLEAILDVGQVLKDRNLTHIKILLIGNGAKKEDLMKRAKEQNLKNIVFHDSVNKTKLASLFKDADLGIQCLLNLKEFYYGTSPNKFFDYLSGGLPVINNYPGWLADMITECDCGYVVPPNDPRAFVDALVEAASDKKKLKIKAEAAKSLSEKFSRKKLAKKWVQLIENTAKK